MRLAIKFLAILTLVAIPALGGCTNGGCTSPQETTQPDIARYTADQVIAVAQADGYDSLGGRYKLAWSVEYLGLGKWLVTQKYQSTGGAVVGTDKGYFYEDTGKLQWFEFSSDPLTKPPPITKPN